jgi:hypothetical protein
MMQGQQSQFEIDDDDVSFQPASSFTGRGAMDHAPSFQNNNSNNGGNGNDNYGNDNYGNGNNGNNNNNNNNHGNNSNLSWYQRITNCFSISSLEQHFNVDTIDIQNRIKSSFLDANKPNQFRQLLYTNSINNGNNNNGNERQMKPDLYGPVWITMTLVFFLAVTGNTAKYLQTDEATVQYDVTHLTKAFTILSIYTFLLPSLLYIMMQCVNVRIGLVELICLYGYSLTPFLPVTILCLVPVVVLEWMFLLVATGWSLNFIVRNVVGVVMDERTVAEKWGRSLVGFIVTCHFIFYLVLKLVFYHHRGGGDVGGGGSDGGNSNSGQGNNGEDGIDNDDGNGTRFY